MQFVVKNLSFNWICRASRTASLLLAWQIGGLRADANPTGGTVSQGAASFNSSGSTFTVNSTTANTFINWQSFNIANGETTIFNEPSSSSIVWNQINDANPSQILGNLNANGYVILQNQHGFYVGGTAAITAHGLVLTTSPTPAPTLSSGGAWEFDTPPPAADIINYGKITITGGGSAYLIADNIQNYGTISAEQGSVGLYAGKQVLLSTSPDGRGINAKITLPQGSVDNEGNLIADGGTIAALAQTVNQNGLIQANSAQNINGTIELIAGDNVNLGASSVISAHGNSTGVSSGGVVTVKSANTFSDQVGSIINIAGGIQGGDGGTLEISAPNLGAIQSQINGHATTGFLGGAMTIDPTTITLDANQESTYNNLITSGGLSQFTVSADEILVNASWTTPAGLSQLNLTASDDITFFTIWSLADTTVSSTLNLSAGNSIIFSSPDSLTGNPTGLTAGMNWNLNLTAGTSFVPTAAQLTPVSGSDGVYLNDRAHITAQNGNINVWAANEVQIASDSSAGEDGIRTLDGGSIQVTAQYGDVNTGGNTAGFDFNSSAAPFYTVDSSVGGISTAVGGNVSINAGGNVYSFVPLGDQVGLSTSDAGTGAFGPEAGNVTITAGGSVYGHYVLANGVGTITANGGDVGTPFGPTSFALSLINGSWNVNAPNGNIYLQEVRDPNGVDNNLEKVKLHQPTQLAGYHLFDYGAQASVDLNAGIGVYLTDTDLPRPNDAIPVLYPPGLSISAGSGGVTLEGNVTLFPSPDQNLSIITTDGGNLFAEPNPSGSQYELLMSDSAQIRWPTTINGTIPFSDEDHGTLQNEPTDPTPVTINISGSIEDLTLLTTKATTINVGGNMVNCNFSGQNLSSSDVTSITVNGQIYNQSAYTYVDGVSFSSIPREDLPFGVANTWDTVFLLAVDPTRLANLVIPNTVLNPPAGTSLEQSLFSYAFQQASIFESSVVNGKFSSSGDQGFIYTAATGRLWYGGPMSATLLSELSGPITVLHLVNGVPEVDASGHFVTDTYNWASPSLLSTLFTQSQADPISIQAGYRLGGPGQFDITAGSISLGNSYGILSCGAYDPSGGGEGGFDRYQNLATITPSGAEINVTLTGPDQTATETLPLLDGTTLTIAPHASLDLLTSTIATLGGGDLNLMSLQGSLDLGASQVFNTGPTIGLGVYTAAGGDVKVTALGDVNIDGSRVGTYNGGNIFIESYGGNVDVGSGGASQSGELLTYTANGIAGINQEFTFGSGIIAYTLTPGPTATLVSAPSTSLTKFNYYSGFPPSGFSVNVATVPGNITVLTPKGNITSDLGGITQQVLGGTTTSGPIIDLEAGTSATVNSSSYAGTIYTGNVDLGQGGAIGGTVIVKATGNATGLIISSGNSTVQAAQNANVSVIAGGSADVSGASVSGLIVGVGGATVSGSDVSATVLSQNANVNGASSSTLGSTATATSTSQSAAQQAGNDAKQEVASNDNTSDDDKKKKKSALIQRVKRVTVILPQKA